jgi:acetyl esterase/lipase
VVAEAVVAMGITACVLTYRLRDWSTADSTFEQRALVDAQRAVRLVRAHARAWDIDPQQIGIGGFSAGAHLSAHAATRGDAGIPDHADPVEQQSSRPDYGVLIYGSFAGLTVVATTPPCFIVHAADDALVPAQESVSWFNSLHALQVPAELHLYAKGGHGFGLGVPGTPAASCPGLMRTWLEALPP